MRSRSLLVIAAFSLLGFACSSNEPASQPSPTPTDSATTVGVAGLKFTPEALTITAGTKVKWSWSGSLPHNVVADDGTFTSGDPVGADEFERTFDTAGTFAYFCSIHGGKGGLAMSGKIIVA